MQKINFVRFPALYNANEDGLLAMGNELSVDILVSAYAQGIFPWYNPGQPVLWWSPDPRTVLYPDQFKLSRSLRKHLRNASFELKADTAFAQVLDGCAWRGQVPEQEQAPDTWITQDMRTAYIALHERGYAHSIEVWQGDLLIGGLYGIAIGSVFCGESMFSRRSNASKVALWGLCQWLIEKNYPIIDCQIENPHLTSLGATEIPRSDYIGYLSEVDIDQASSGFGDGFSEFIQTLRSS